MTKEELIKRIDDKINNLKVPFTKLREFSYLKEILEKNKYQTPEEYNNINIWEFIIGILYADKEDLHDVSYYEEFIKPWREYHNSMSIDIQAIFYEEILDYLYDEEKLKEFENDLNSGEFFNHLELSIKKKHNSAKSDIDNAKLNREDVDRKTQDQGNVKGKETCKIILTIIDENSLKIMINLITGLMNYELGVYGLMKLDEAIKDVLEESRDVRRYVRKNVSSEIKSMQRIEEGIMLLKIVMKYTTAKEEEEKKYYLQKDKEIKSLEKIKNLLDNESKEEIQNIKDYIVGIKDKELLEEILRYIYQYNEPYYECLQQEYNSLKENTINHYRSILKKYKVMIDKREIKRIMRNSVKDVETILEIITKYTFTNNQIIEILERSNRTIVESIKKYLDKGYIIIEFLINNIDLFFLENKKREELEESWKYLQENDINPMIFKNQIEVLTNNENLFTNLEVLKKYGLIKSLKKSKNLEFLKSTNLEEIIDTWIELGYSSYLEENIDILNYQNIKRLKIYQELGINKTKEESLEILESPKFFIDDSLIEQYITDIDYSIIDAEDLESFRIDSRTYKINDTYYSLPKLIRKKDNYDSKRLEMK